MLHDLSTRKVLILAFVILVVALGFQAMRELPALWAMDFSNPDSYTRLVLLRDWQAGMGYQYMARDAAPGGSYLHWSMVYSWVLQQVAGGLQWAGLPQESALVAAGASLTWISYALLGLFAVLAILAVGGRLGAIATVLVVVSSQALQAYGKLTQITHHLFMLVPLAVAAWLIFRHLRVPTSPGAAAAAPPPEGPAHGVATRQHTTAAALGLAGACLGLSLWISPETMPFIAGLAALLASHRLQYGGRPSCWPLAAGLCAILLWGGWVDPPPPTFSAWALDHLSLAWLAWAGGLSALLLLADVLASQPRLPIALRFSVIAAATLAAAAIWVGFTPGALAGPSGLLPDELKTLWWRHINELRSTQKPSEVLAWVVLPCLAGAWLLVRAWRARCLWWAVLGAMAVAYAGLTAWHVRMGAAASLAGALAWGVALCGQRAFVAKDPTRLPKGEQYRAAAWLLAPAALLLLMVAAFLVETRLMAAPAEPVRCPLAPIAADLTALPPATVLIPLNQAPELLWRTPHRVIAGNYHHNVQGILDTYHIWLSTGDDARARAIIDRREVHYLLVCADPDDAGSTLYARLARGEAIAWATGPIPMGAWNRYDVTSAP
ncbi:hypothetical protein [Castellaniella sp.]|uniref:hypothetical protein n=1 Tax=Castellaniella sp. TaxID=1955812 RepID=UPI0035671152